jgi:hypothetical protein
MKTVTIERHSQWRISQQLLPLTRGLFTFAHQGRILREILDISPPYYISKMLPWTLKQLSHAEKVKEEEKMNSCHECGMYTDYVLCFLEYRLYYYILCELL